VDRLSIYDTRFTINDIRLKKHQNIRQFSAAFFLLLFAFCATPKRFLHDLLANHQDSQFSATHAPKHISASGFHCHVDDLVVVEPFLPGIQDPLKINLASSPANFFEPLRSFVIQYLPQSDGRGPPPVFCS
jgi:hypothetical protein